jgi:hypothetical protein
MSPECTIETAIPRPLSVAAAEPFPQGSTLIPFGMEICEVQIVFPVKRRYVYELQTKKRMAYSRQ